MKSERESTYRTALARLSLLDIGQVRWNEPLRNHCSWRIGGPADLLVEPDSIEQVKRLVRAVGEAGIPFVVIGQGTNLLFADEGVRGVVMKIGSSLSNVSIRSGRIVAEGGVWVPRLARLAGKAGLSGLEHIVGIPGTIGGLIIMNGGSQRREIGANVVRVWGITREGKELCFSREECGFSYRSSIFKGGKTILVKVELECADGDPRAIHREMLKTLRERRCKFPLKEPNCGSVFLSAPALYATLGPPGKIIENAGLKGMRVGGAQISVKHANFIVNLEYATARDVLKLIGKIRSEVLLRSGALLKSEVMYVSHNGIIEPATECINE